MCGKYRNAQPPVLLCGAPDASGTWCYGCMNYHCILCIVFVICGITTVYYIPQYTMFYMRYYHCILYTTVYYVLYAAFPLYTMSGVCYPVPPMCRLIYSHINLYNITCIIFSAKICFLNYVTELKKFLSNCKLV